VKVAIEFESDEEVVEKSFDMIRALIDEFKDRDPRIAELEKSLSAYQVGIPAAIGSRGWGGATIGISREMNMPHESPAAQEVQEDYREAMEQRDHVPLDPQRNDVKTDYAVVSSPVNVTAATYTDIETPLVNTEARTAFKDYILSFHMRRFK
jgi:hypothetical protein